MGSIICKTGNSINKYFSVIFLLWFMNSCNIDVRDCRLIVVNQMQRDIYIFTAARKPKRIRLGLGGFLPAQARQSTRS
jgi:hypothetical protein